MRRCRWWAAGLLALGMATPAQAQEWAAPAHMGPAPDWPVPALAHDGSRLQVLTLSARNTLELRAREADGRVVTLARRRAGIVGWPAALEAVGPDPPVLIVARRAPVPRRHVVARAYVAQDGRIRLSRTLSRGRANVADLRASVSPNGWIAAVWSRAHRRTRRVQVAVRSPGGRWAPTRTLSAPAARSRDASVAIGDDGLAVVAWRRRGVVEATTVRDGSAVAPVALGPARYGTGNLDVAVGPGGAAVVAWAELPFETAAGGTRILAAVRGQGGTFGGAIELDDLEVGATGPTAAMHASGAAVVTWSDIGAVQRAAWVSGGKADVRDLRPPPGLQPAYAGDAAIAVTPGGETVVAWAEGHQESRRYEQSEHGRVLAATADATGTWREPQVVWSDPDTAPGEAVALAVSPQGTVWLGFYGGGLLVAERPPRG